MNNADLLAKALTNWIKPIVTDTFIPSLDSMNLPSWAKYLTDYTGIDLRNYSLSNQLNFIIDPIIKRAEPILTSNLTKYISFIPDEEIPEMFNEIIDNAIKQSAQNGDINFYGCKFSANAFKNLQNEFNQQMNNLKVFKETELQKQLQAQQTQNAVVSTVNINQNQQINSPKEIIC